MADINISNSNFQGQIPDIHQQSLDVHIDILQEIFHRLPLKSMVIFKIVCKTWNSIISNPQFLQETINRRLVGNHLIFFNRNSIKLSIYTFDNHNRIHENEINSITFSDFDRSTFDPYKQNHIDMFLGTCNGLVALLLNRTCFLCNPLTGEYTNYSLKKTRKDYINRYKKHQVGLCYDALEDEYIILIVYRLSFGGRLLRFNHERGTCKNVGINLPNKSYFVEGNGKVFCGNAHWICQETNGIIYFDAKKGRFNNHMMNLPDFNGDDRIMGFAAVDGEHQLGVVVGNMNSSCVEVWVMKEYGNHQSWTHLLQIKINVPNLNNNVDDLLLYLNVLGYKSTTEILIDTSMEGLLWVYDLQQNDLRKVQIYSEIDYFSRTYLANYTPSLISASFLSKRDGRLRQRNPTCLEAGIIQKAAPKRKRG